MKVIGNGKRPMRILHLYKDYLPVLGGIEGHIASLAQGQAAAGHEVTVLVTRPGGMRTRRHDERGVAVVRAGRFGVLRSTPISPALVAELARQGPDVVHVHAPYPPAELAQGLLRRGRATVVGYHSDVVRQRLFGALWAPLQRRLLRRADAVLVASVAYRASSATLGNANARTHIVPYGIDLDRFAAAEPSEVDKWRRRFPGQRILFVGRHRYYKGIEHLIDAVGALPDARLLIAGRGPMENAWRGRAATSPAAERIAFLGDIDDARLPALYAAADVFVLPSTVRSEAFGIVLVEAMAAGLPVISTALGTATSEINADGETGFVVPPRDASALAEAIRAAYTERDRLGRAARARAHTRYGLARMIDAVEAVYREALSARGGPQPRPSDGASETA